MQPSARVLDSFRTYRHTGTRPFYTQRDFNDRMISILNKTFYSDIPFFLPKISEGNLRLMRAITVTLSNSSIPRLQVQYLCNDWVIGAEKLYQLLDVMESVDFLRIIRKEHNSKAKTVGEKLFFSDPSFYTILGGNIGNTRESMVAMLFTYSGYLIEAIKDETTGNFVLTKSLGDDKSKIKIEIGGSSKRPKKADFVIRDDIDYPGGNTISFWLVGMMY